ncbi:hypothetical protein [Enterobacter cloacae]|uniref:hypothetical protein n=1 Tax=Enterobacter cloacae TaxID=550 RepID=UPI00316DBBB1
MSAVESLETADLNMILVNARDAKKMAPQKLTVFGKGVQKSPIARWGHNYKVACSGRIYAGKEL